MTGRNIMLWTKCSIALLTFCVCWTCPAATHHRYECPSPLIDGKFKRSLWRVNVYDGPPKNMASLIVWESLNHVDVYLVCTYKGTDKTAAVHAEGASSCDTTDKPPAAFCD
jgi:hypothetical protein